MGAATPGAKLGRYHVVKHLASGGMAEVLLARASGIEGFTRHVVIKRIRPDQADNAQFVQMFLNEARLAAQLHHHNIVQVHDIGQEGEEYFFAMEYVHGEDLRRLLTNVARHQDKVPLEHVVSIVSAVATALHHAHEQRGADRKPLSIVHRDVSPANILVGYDGHVKVVDFGIAKAAASTHQATVAGALKGKASYMAPEQCTGKGVIDRRTDVFALGIVLYELVTARRLFKGENDFLTMSAIVGGNVPPARNHRPDLPAELEAIIMKALATAPADRYQTAEDMHGALEAFANSMRLRPSTSGLAAYMKQLFGERPEPWLVDDENVVVSIDFDGSASGMARPPTEALEAHAIPETIEAMKSSPIMRARTKAATNAPPLAAVATHTSGPIAKPRAPTRQVAIPAASPTPDKPVRRATRSDVVPGGLPTPQAGTRKITVQIPVAAQAAGITPRGTTNAGVPAGITMDESGATVVSGIPKDVDTSWDPSRPMAAPQTATAVAGDRSSKAVSPAAGLPGMSTAPAQAAATPQPVTNAAPKPAALPARAVAPLKPVAVAAPTAPPVAAPPPAALPAAAPPAAAQPAAAPAAVPKLAPATATASKAAAPAVTPKSDPAIKVGAPAGVAPKSDPAIKVGAAAGVAPKSDPAIKVGATAGVAPKSDPAIKLGAAAGAAPKSDPAIKVEPPKASESGSRLSPTALAKPTSATPSPTPTTPASPMPTATASPTAATPASPTPTTPASPTPAPAAASAAASDSTARAKLPAPRKIKLPGIAGADDSKPSFSPSTDANVATSSTAAAETAAPADAGAPTADSMLGGIALDAPSPFAAAPAVEDSPFAARPPAADAPEGDRPVPLAAAATASAAAFAGASTATDSLAATASVSPSFGGAPPFGATTPPSTAAPDPWASGSSGTKSPGILAKVLGSPKRIAIAAGGALVLIVVIVMAAGGGGDKKAKPAASPGTAAGVTDDLDKRGSGKPDDKADKADETPTAVEHADDKANAEPAGSAAPTDPAAGSAADTGTAGDSGSGSPGTTAVDSTATKPTKRVTTKTTAKTTTATKATAVKQTATKTTAVKTTATKTTAVTKTPTKTATPSKTAKPAVQKTGAKKCDPNALFPCKKKK